MTEQRDEWGPLIEHDGAAPQLPAGVVIWRFHDKKTVGRTGPGDGSGIALQHPCWFWRWQLVRVGWLKREWRRICDDPSYCPIIAYRIRRPRGLAILETCLTDLPAPQREGEPA